MAVTGFLVVCGVAILAGLCYYFRDIFKPEPVSYSVTVPKNPRPVQPKPVATLGAKNFPQRPCDHYKHEREPIGNPWARKTPETKMIVAAADARLAKIDRERAEAEAS